MAYKISELVLHFKVGPLKLVGKVVTLGKLGLLLQNPFPSFLDEHTSSAGSVPSVNFMLAIVWFSPLSEGRH